MLSSFLKSSSLEQNAFTQVVFPLHPPASHYRCAFPADFPVGGPSPTESASCCCWCGCVDLVEAKMGSGMGMSALGHFKLEKKLGRNTELPS